MQSHSTVHSVQPRAFLEVCTARVLLKVVDLPRNPQVVQNDSAQRFHGQNISGDISFVSLLYDHSRNPTLPFGVAERQVLGETQRNVKKGKRCMFSVETIIRNSPPRTEMNTRGNHTRTRSQLRNSFSHYVSRNMCCVGGCVHNVLRTR